VGPEVLRKGDGLCILVEGSEGMRSATCGGVEVVGRFCVSLSRRSWTAADSVVGFEVFSA